MTARAARFLILAATAAVAGGCATPTTPAPGGPAAAASAATPRPAGSATAAPVATTPPAAPPAPSAAGRPASSPTATATPQPPGAGQPPGSPPGPPPFATVIKDARRIDGPITAWQKEDKLWLELKPEQLGKPYLFVPKIRSGIGEGLLVGGLMTYPTAGAGGMQVVEFVRVLNTIRLQARNTDVLAKDGTPEARAVAASYSASLLGAAPVASQPHPDRKSILIDASSMFINDLAGIGMQLQRQFRQGYSPDPRNSMVTGVRGSDDALIIETQTHWFTGAVSTQQNFSPLAALAGVAAPTVPRWLPDTRSMLIGQHLSLSPLPEPPMPTRRADPRVGLFSTAVQDFSNDTERSTSRRHILRWRLEKKDPSAALSEPVRPITFWLDRNVPLAYRDTARAAVLEWNKAFERIGFKDALRVEQQADDARFETLDPGRASVRWLMSADPAITAIGQAQFDPRSGEILGADVAFEGMFTRAQRYLRSQLLDARAAAVARASAAPATHEAPPPFAQPLSFAGLIPGGDGVPGQPGHELFCRHADQLAEQARYAFDVMEARGEIRPDSPEAQQFVLDFLKETLMHEVGHALGLRHNFRASRAYTEEQLADPEFTKANGTTGSVMEYNAINLARPGRSGGTAFSATLGPYDYWAIEYAYKPLPPGAKPEDEAAQLQAVASRNHEPLLAFGTDEDAFLGVDAETIQWDLGADPVAFARKRLDIARDLFRRQETRDLPQDHDYSVLRRSLNYALGDAVRALGVLVRQMGGLRTLRDYPGSGRDPIAPVAAAVQRESFEQVVAAVFAPDGFRISPALQRRLAPDFLDRGELPGLATDYNLPQRLLELQRAVLAYLMSDGLSIRLLDANDKFDGTADRLTVAEVHRRVAQALWTELSAKASSVPTARRDLQRDHVNRLAFAVLRPTPGGRADQRAALRHEAQRLLQRLNTALRQRGWDEPTRLHLSDSADSLRQALDARLPRAGI